MVVRKIFTLASVRTAAGGGQNNPTRSAPVA
jgi:hypothetical protein